MVIFNSYVTNYQMVPIFSDQPKWWHLRHQELRLLNALNVWTGSNSSRLSVEKPASSNAGASGMRSSTCHITELGPRDSCDTVNALKGLEFLYTPALRMYHFISIQIIRTISYPTWCPRFTAAWTAFLPSIEITIEAAKLGALTLLNPQPAKLCWIRGVHHPESSTRSCCWTEMGSNWINFCTSPSTSTKKRLLFTQQQVHSEEAFKLIFSCLPHDYNVSSLSIGRQTRLKAPFLRAKLASTPIRAANRIHGGLTHGTCPHTPTYYNIPYYTILPYYTLGIHGYTVYHISTLLSKETSCIIW